MTPPPPETIAQAILTQAAARGPEKSICPSEVARALAGPEDAAWQPLMGAVRQAALVLQGEGRLDILRKGKPVPAEAVRGVIRLRIRPPGAMPAEHGDGGPAAAHDGDDA